jgi:protein-tyrosine phosphatase
MNLISLPQESTMDNLDFVLLEPTPSVAYKVHENLWIGSAPSIGHTVSQFFSYLVLSAVEYQPIHCFPGVHVLPVILTDHGSPMTFEEKKLAVAAAGKIISILPENKPILVSCHKGLNRSGLLCALTLCLGPTKMSPFDAIETVRKARGHFVLSNKYFVNFIHEYCSNFENRKVPE